MTNYKIGVFSALIFSVLMLTIPASSLANAQEYNKDYEENTVYEESYNKEDKKSSEDPLIIIKNEPFKHKEKKKEKKMKEPAMLLVEKEVLFCDTIASDEGNFCENDLPNLPGPDSGRYVECTDEGFFDACEKINAELFNIVVTDDIEFLGSEEGTKLTYNGERYTVTEENTLTFESDEDVAECQASGFDSATGVFTEDLDALVCILFEGDCSGFVQDKELKECTVKNYVVAVGD